MGGPVTLEPATGVSTPAHVSDSGGRVLGRPARILLASDNALILAGLETVLSAEIDLRIVADARSSESAVMAVRHVRPDLLLLDIAMNGGASIDVLRSLRDEPDLRIMLLAAGIDVCGVFHALELGARGVLVENVAPALMVKAIRAVLRGEYWVSREVIGELARRLSRAGGQTAPQAAQDASKPAYRLTRRERDIVDAVVEGCSNRDIATRLRVREDTIKQHLTKIFEKLGIANRVELARFAIDHRLTDAR